MVWIPIPDTTADVRRSLRIIRLNMSRLADSGHFETEFQCPLLGVKRISGGTRFSFICALSASRGHVGERAFHLLFNALHCAGADADLARGGVDALPGAQLSLDTFARLYGPLKASGDSLADHAALELGKGTFKRYMC
jgi:hypothetical protein